METIMGDKYENVNISGQGVAIGRGASASVSHSHNTLHSNEDLADALSAFAKHLRGLQDRDDAELEATLIDVAAQKAKDGDPSGATAVLRKSAAWVLDLGKSVGGAVLTAFLKSYMGLG